MPSACATRYSIQHPPPGDEHEALPVPATLLIDSDGTVLWMDIAENYQRRSGPEVVLAAIEEHLG